jgi:hypothetical protein
MLMLARLLPALALAALTARAVPLVLDVLGDSTGTPVALTSAAIAAFLPYSNYAAAGMCTPASILAWSCGRTFFLRGRVAAGLLNAASLTANCAANPSFVPVAAGGDGNVVEYCTCTRRLHTHRRLI